MTFINNPFVTSGYIVPEYFCDREKETETLLRWLVNENNVAIISTRRMGKTGLIQHCFQQSAVKDHYYTFLIDIYATKTLREFVFQLGKTILAALKSQGRKTWELFVNSLTSLKAGFTFDISGMPNGILNWEISSRRRQPWMKYSIIYLSPINLVLSLSMNFSRSPSIPKRIRKRCSAPISSIVRMPVSYLPVRNVI